MQPNLRTVTVDARATAAWSADASAYERVRPGWPPAAVDWLCAGLPDGAPVLDLAAGTGKLTRDLVARGYAVTAVEPLPGMRAQLASVAPVVLEGVAESIPCADGAFAIVFVAEAFHWFSAPAAVAEMRRVAPRAGLLWNLEAWDDEPWYPELHALLGPGRGHHPGRRGTWDGLGDAEARRFAHAHTLSAEGFAQLVGTWSRVAARPDRAELLHRVRDTVPDPVELRYETLAVAA